MYGSYNFISNTKFVLITGSPGKPGKPKAFIEGNNVVIRWTTGTEGDGPISAYYIQANNLGELFEILKLFLCNMMLYLDKNIFKILKLNTCTVTFICITLSSIFIVRICREFDYSSMFLNNCEMVIKIFFYLEFQREI